MKLLILTQKIDKDDDILGFFHGWVLEFAKKFDKITVVCLEKGQYSLQDNVRIFSLGKEKKTGNLQSSSSRLKYIFNFYRHIWRERKNYDAVFVHMNQEYILLGGILWKLLGKKIFLWRNHLKGSFLTNAAVSLADKVFCTSPFAYTARFTKTLKMSAGIDTELFKRQAGLDAIARPANTLLYLGRISPVKKIEDIVDAAKEMDRNGIDFNLSIYGDPTPVDGKYHESILKSADDLVKKRKIRFFPGLSHDKISYVYNSHEILINTTPTGSFDKVILEMMATEGLAVVFNESFGEISPRARDLLIAKGELADFNSDSGDPGDSRDSDDSTLASKVEKLMKLSFDEKIELGKELRDWVIKNHSLKKLAEDLYEIMK